MSAKYLILLLTIFISSYAFSAFLPKQHQLSERLNLPVTEIRDNFRPYQDFCSRNPGECNLSGQATIKLTPKKLKQLREVNTVVNREINLVFDNELYQKEEFWTYPSTGYGDCEDIALEKRSRLVQLGFPRGSLRIGLGYHKNLLVAHAVLTVETQQGTFVLDSLYDQVKIWYQTPYNFETRERTDGTWERYDQSLWTFN